MPSVQSLPKMSQNAIDNLIAKAGSIPVTGVSFVEADDAADSKFEPSDNLDSLLSALIVERGVTGTLDALGDDATAFKLVWDHLDDNYSYYNTAINDAFIDLGIAYSDYLLDGGEKLLDVVKYAADGGDADALPERSQTLHDNILGNFDELSIADKFGSASSDIFERIQDAGLGEILGVIGDYTDGRGIYDGTAGDDPSHQIAFDQVFFA